MIGQFIKNNLMWFPEDGVGYYPVNGFPYNEDYFNKYYGYSLTDMGIKITQARVSIVSRYYSGKVLDVGIGSGQFVMARENTFGYDVNPAGIKWLEHKKYYSDLYGKKRFDALTFWDTLEHIEEPDKAVKQSRKWVFVSMPIFDSLSQLLGSKHLRRDEHYWYFTHDGLVNWFSKNSFDLVNCSNVENDLGRENVSTYVFRRRGNG